jgi:hypothetical protein
MRLVKRNLWYVWRVWWIGRSIDELAPEPGVLGPGDRVDPEGNTACELLNLVVDEGWHR